MAAKAKTAAQKKAEAAPKEVTNVTIPSINNAQSVAVEERDCHHMIRSVGPYDRPEIGLVSADTADNHVKGWLRAGFDLHSVVPLGHGEADGAFFARVLYIFISA